MHPYKSPRDTSCEPRTRQTSIPSDGLRVASAAIGTAVSVLALLVATFAIFYYIYITFQLFLGIWVITLFGIAVGSAPVVGFIVYRVSLFCSARQMFLPYVFAAVALILMATTSASLFSWIQQAQQSFLKTYSLVVLLMTLPSCLIGFIVAGLVGWLLIPSPKVRRT